VTAAIQNPYSLEKPLKLSICYTETCNLSCHHCYADCSSEKARAELTADEWDRFLNEISELGVVYLYIEGGEPFHRPDFLSFLASASNRFFTEIRTNGTLITRELAQRLKELGVGIVLVDILSPHPEVHDLFTEVQGSQALSCKAVEFLLEAGIETQLLTILNRRNVDDLQSYIDLAQRLGVKTAGILRPYPLGRFKHRWKDVSLSLDEMHAALNSLQLPSDMKLMHSWHPNDGNSCWQMAAVNAFGSSIGCAYLREYVDYGNIRDVSFMETWQHPLYRELRSGRVTETCPSCSSSQGSHGGCRSTAYAFHGAWDAPDPFDRHLNKGVDLRVLPEWLLQPRPKPPGAPS
jgi:radical SAM protein with 4Fe4S-binding SPASM domain